MAYDLIVLVFAGGGALLGYKRGFAVHAAGIVSLVLGFALGIPLTNAVLGAMGETSPGGRLLVFLGCYAAVTFACHLVGIKARSRLKKRSLESWDRQLGAALGLLHGLFACLMLTFAAVVLVPSLREPIAARPSGQAMGQAFRAIHAVLPAGVQEGMQPLIERAQREE